MNVFIMRHGDANTEIQQDKERPLTDVGILETKVMAKWLKSELINFDAVFVSPYLRAQQTAKTLANEMLLEVNLQTLNFITPAGSASETHDYLDAIISLEKLNNVLVVSHMPLVSYLVAEMSVEKSSPIFATASIAELNYDTAKMKGHIIRHIAPDDIC